MAPWTEEAHAAGRELSRRILEHPFIRELRDGTLPGLKFIYYLGQSVHFVDAAVKAGALAAAKAPDRETRDLCLLRGPGGRDEFDRLDTPQSVRSDRADAAPTCRGYTLHLLTIAYSRDAVDLLAALLPHRRSYEEIAASLDAKLDPPFRREWMRFYRDPEYSDLVARHRAIVDRLTAELPPGRRAQLLEDYLLSLRYEHRFWDMAYARERWPSDAPLI